MILPKGSAIDRVTKRDRDPRFVTVGVVLTPQTPAPERLAG